MGLIGPVRPTGVGGGHGACVIGSPGAHAFPAPERNDQDRSGADLFSSDKPGMSLRCCRLALPLSALLWAAILYPFF